WRPRLTDRWWDRSDSRTSSGTWSRRSRASRSSAMSSPPRCMGRGSPARLAGPRLTGLMPTLARPHTPPSSHPRTRRRSGLLSGLVSRASLTPFIAARRSRCSGAAGLKGTQTSNRPAHDERMDVVGTLIGVDRLEVRRVAHHLELGGNAVAAVHIAGCARDLQRLAAIVALYQADRLRNQLAGLQPAADPKRRLQPERDLGYHVRELQLDELV